MKKFILWMLTVIWLGFWTLFAQSILPDEAKIDIKSPIIQWEAANLTVTMMKNGSKMSSYVWTILITITEENWSPLKANDYTLPSFWMYDFEDTDLWSKEFQKWVEIKKEWKFYIEVSDLNDLEDKVLWRELVTVIRKDVKPWNAHIEVYSPVPDITLTNEKVEIIASVPELKNSSAIIYLDDNPIESTITDSEWMINYIINNVTAWRHSINIEVIDMDGSTVLWSSDKIYFTTSQTTTSWIKRIEIEPEEWLMVGDMTKITVYTDEMIESVRMNLSDRSENDSEVLPKIWNWQFSKDIFLFKSWTIDISLETSASNGNLVEKFDKIKQFIVSDIPVISNITTWTDAENQIATISWDILGTASSYLITYRLWEEWESQSTQQEQRTDTKSFKFTDVPYDTTLNIVITPYRWDQSKHWAASETIKFIITKPQPITQNPDDTSLSWVMTQPRCIIENISTRTTKIWDNYFLIWDKVENVSKYIIYSSTKADGSDKIKVYETSDTSYQYPFDRTSEEDKFAYFWIVWICDDWEELELTWATKVQVWPAENFFLLLCMTFLIYFWIKLFRQTEE